VSLDGCLDDAGPDRLILSSPEDLAAVDALRAQSDAILVGAGTLRADNPRLRVRSAELLRQRRESGRPEQPLRVTLTSTGDLSPDWNIWGEDPQTPLVFCPETARAHVESAIGSCATIVAAGATRVDSLELLQDLRRRGVQRLLIEGGANVNAWFLQAGLVDELRVSIAPVLVGHPNAPRLVAPLAASVGRLSLQNVERLGDCVVLNYTCSSVCPADQQWLRQAINLSRRCPKSETSFAVGAVIVSESGTFVADGYSLEDGASRHAEEVAIDKAVRAGRSLSGTTLYSSLEPCSVRKSGKVPCTEHIIAAGISRVVFALHEPDLFVDCQGAERLRDAGIEIRHVPSLAQQVREVNSHLLKPQ